MIFTLCAKLLTILLCSRAVRTLSVGASLPKYLDEVSPQGSLAMTPNSVSVPIHEFRNPTHYYIDITIGTPPQPIRALLAIDFNGMAIFSSKCDTAVCGHHLKYDHEASSTFESTSGAIFQSDFAEFYTEGPAARDIVRMSGLEIYDHCFEEATKVTEGGVFGDTIFDGIVGLSRFDFTRLTSNLTRMNPFLHMVDKGLLPRNTISLRLPKSWTETGMLILGAEVSTPIPAWRSSMTLPLTSVDSDDPVAHEYLGNGWQTGLHQVHVNAWQDHELFDITLENYTVVFSTELPYLMLPWGIMNGLRFALGLDEDDEPLVDCDKRSIMPNITFRIGAGSGVHNVFLTPWEYTTTEGLAWWPPGLCALPWGGLSTSYQDYVVLGTAFLRQYDSVFDYDSATVTCGSKSFANGELNISTNF